MGDTVCGYYRPPEQEEEINKAFCRELKEGSESQALVFMGN